MKILVIVNDSPWGSALPATALRLTRTVLAAGKTVEAVFFRGDGVYNAIPGRGRDAGTPDLAREWAVLSASGDFPLLVCSAAASRRLDSEPGHGFREAGLAEVFERLTVCDRLVAF